MVDLTRWSHSRLDCYQRCPRRWALHYIHEEPEQPVPILVNGTQMHEAIREYGALCWRKKVFELPSAIPEIAGGIEDAETQAKFSRWAREKQWDFREWFGNAEFELEQEVALPQDLGTWVQHLDWLRLLPSIGFPGEQEAIVRDWKSGWAGDRKTGTHPPKQLQRYAWGIMAALPHVAEVRMEIEFIGGGTILPGFHDDDAEWCHGRAQTSATLRALVSDIKRVQANIALGGDLKHWETKAGDQCKSCGYQHKCPAAELAVAMAATEDGERPMAEMGDAELRALEAFNRAQADGISKELRARAKETGPIVAGDGTEGYWYPQAPSTVVTNMNTLVGRLIEGKADLDKLLTLKRGAGARLRGDEFGRYDDLLKEKPGSMKWGYKRVAGSDGDDEGESDEQEAP